MNNYLPILKHSICQNKILYLVILIVILFTSLQIKPFFSTVYVPDEAWFHWLVENKAQEISWSQVPIFIITQENELGYGSIYWILYTLTAKIFSTFGNEIVFGIARIISWLAVCLIPVIIYYYGSQKNQWLGLLTVLLWLSFPIAWWYGKLTAPEPILIFLCTLGLILTLLKEKAIGWLLLGLSVGLKLNALPVMLFALLYTTIKKGSLQVQYIIYIVIGFVAANPFIISNPFRYLKNFNDSTSIPNYSLDHLAFILSNNYWEWDILLNGGLFQWSMSILSFTIFLTILYTTKNKPLSFSFLLTFAFSILLFLSNSRFLGWYWFPFISILPIVLLISWPEKISKHYYALFFLLIGTNIITQSHIIIEGYQLRLEHIKNISAKQDVQLCLTQELNKNQFDQIVNMSEIRLKLDFPEHFGSSVEFYPSYKPLILHGSNVLVIVGSRVSKIEPYKSLSKNLEENDTFLNLSTKYLISQKHKCDFVNFYNLKKYEHTK